MEALSKNTGVSVVWNCNAKAFIYDKKLQKIWDSKQMPTEVFLLSKNDNTAAFQIEKKLKKVLGDYFL
jgi:hypothetical protein